MRPTPTTREKVERLRATGGDRCTFHFPAETMELLARARARSREVSLSKTVQRLIRQAVEAEEARS